MEAAFAVSLAPGTLANRYKQAQEYVRFSLIYKVPFLAPDLTQACMFAQFLVNNHAAPSTIKNYISGARTWIQEHRGNNSAFYSPQFIQLVKGYIKKSSHVPRQALPLTSNHINVICRFLHLCPSASLCVKPAILIGFSCFLRASNICSPNMNVWAGPHTLLAGDIVFEGNGLLITIRSTKTRSKDRLIAFSIPRGDNPLTCPVQAWMYYKRLVSPLPFGPAFIHANRLPLTGRQVVAIMRLALKGQTDIDPSRVSMHSLRRGATQTSIDRGVPLDDIRIRGTWASDSGMRPYLPSHTRKVHTVPVINLAD